MANIRVHNTSTQYEYTIRVHDVHVAGGYRASYLAKTVRALASRRSVTIVATPRPVKDLQPPQVDPTKMWRLFILVFFWFLGAQHKAYNTERSDLNYNFKSRPDNL